MTNANTSPSDDERDADLTDESRFADLVEEINDEPAGDAETDPPSDGKDVPPEEQPDAGEQAADAEQLDEAPPFMQQSRQRTTPSGPRSIAAGLSLRRKIQIGLFVFFALLLLVSLLWEVVA